MSEKEPDGIDAMYDLSNREICEVYIKAFSLAGEK